MLVSEPRFRPRRIFAFLIIGLVPYLALFIASDVLLRGQPSGNPFARILQAPEHADWIIVGSSHALPLSFDGMPEAIAQRTGQDTLTLALPGAGPFVMRVIAERYLADHDASGVLIVLDSFGFLDPRWNAARLDDTDVLPKIPADWRTLAVFARAVPQGLHLQTAASYGTGFARINDHTRFSPDHWEAESRFDSSPRPSDAADQARIAYLFPGPPDPDAIERGLADLEAMILLAERRGLTVALVRPPLPDRFRRAMPPTADLDERLVQLTDRMGVALIDQSDLIAESRFYFDTDHLNRDGVLRWLDTGLGAILGPDDSRQ